jgi:hypothetical protein
MKQTKTFFVYLIQKKMLQRKQGRKRERERIIQKTQEKILSILIHKKYTCLFLNIGNNVFFKFFIFFFILNFIIKNIALVIIQFYLFI